MIQDSSGKGFRGKWVLLAMVLVAVALAGGLYWIAASDTPVAYRLSKPGAPDSQVRMATIDAQWETGTQKIAESLRAARPDIILVQHITRDSLVELAKAMGMYQAEHFFYSELGIEGRTPGGCGIISRHQLYRHRELRDGTRDTFAVAAETVIASRRFLLISTSIGGPNMLEQAEVLRKTTGLLRIGPMVCAGQVGLNAPQGLRDMATKDGDGLYGSAHWYAVRRGVSGRVIWMDVTAFPAK